MSHASNKILVVVSKAHDSTLRTFLTDFCTSNWVDFVHILADDGPVPFVEKTKFSERISLAAQTTAVLPENILIDREAKFDRRKLKNALGKIGVVEFHETLIQKIKNRVGGLGIDWCAKLEVSMKSCGLERTPTNTWLAQFRHIGAEWVGRMLLQNFTILSVEDEAAGYAVESAAVLGIDCYYAYYEDGDPGGSDVTTRQLLHKKYPDDRVKEIRSFLPEAPDRSKIYLFTDGLWSGSEFTKRLGTFKEVLRKRSDIQMVFRYPVATNFGLIFARSVARLEGLSNVTIEIAPGGQIWNVLGDDAANADTLAKTAPDEASLSDLLHRLVRPVMLAHARARGDDPTEAERVLFSLGHQLARLWVTWDKPQLEEAQREDRARKFALGGGGFGLAVAIHSSVPKVSLPVFWLGGQVEVGGVKFGWQPLLLDLRRHPPANSG